MAALNTFVLGAFGIASAAIGLFFYRYWQRTRERLFAIFAVAFALMALERTVLAFVPPIQEGRHWIFLARLLAFVLIIAGIIDKNRPRRRRVREGAARGEPAEEPSRPHAA